MSNKNDMIWASGHYLGENFPNDYHKWTEDKIYQFCEDHCWEPLEGSDGEWLFEQIEHLAWSVREYINAQKK